MGAEDYFDFERETPGRRGNMQAVLPAHTSASPLENASLPVADGGLRDFLRNVDFPITAGMCARDIGDK